jgi:hypothetical protein
MRVVAVPKARTLAMIEIDSLGFGGHIRIADCIAPIVNRFNFLKYPIEAKDFEIDNGVKFEHGKDGEIAIDALIVYEQAIVVDTFATTDDSQRIISDMLEWGASELSLTYSPQNIMRWGNISHLIFETSIPLLPSISPPLQKLSGKVSEVTNHVFGDLPYELGSISVSHDPLIRKHGIASFTIQHRANTKFEENRYFSEAPLPTSLHIKFLEELERDTIDLCK